MEAIAHNLQQGEIYQKVKIIDSVPSRPPIREATEKGPEVQTATEVQEDQSILQGSSMIVLKRMLMLVRLCKCGFMKADEMLARKKVLKFF